MPTVWSRVKTWVSDEILTAADLNAEFDEGVNEFNAAMNETTGHDHDGVNSKEVSYLSLTDKPTDKNAYLFPLTGSLVEGADVAPLHHEAMESGTILEVRVVVKTAPTGADLIFDINVDGTSIWNSGVDRVRVVAGATAGSTTTITNTSITKGDLIKIDVDQIGSTIAGADATVYLIYAGAL